MSEQSLYARIAQAALAVGSLAAEGKMSQSGQNYEYLTADQVMREAGKALAAAGVAVIPGVKKAEVEQVTYTNNSGKTSTRYDAHLTMTMEVGDVDGNTTRSPWASAGTDYGSPDKAVSKAITTGHKYFLAKLLCLNVGDDDGVKPFYSAMAHKIPYFKSWQHVENTMENLNVAYPENKDEAQAAERDLSRYARMRADGIAQDETLRTIKGGRNGSIDDLR